MAEDDDENKRLIAELQKRRSVSDGYSKIAEALQSRDLMMAGPPPDASALSLFARGKLGVARKKNIGYTSCST